MTMFLEAGLEATGTISNKTKIRYLKRYIWLDREIDRKCNEISKLRANLTKVTPVYSNELKGGGSIYGKTEDIVARIVDLEADINADIDQLVQLQKNIEHIVKAVENDQERLLLQYRYLDGQTFEWIAAQMNYHWRSIHKIHVRALSRLEIGQ